MHEGTVVQVVYCRAFVAQQNANATPKSRKPSSEEQALPCLPFSQSSFHCDGADPEAQDLSREAADEPLPSDIPKKKSRLSSWKRRAAAKARQRCANSGQSGECV